MKRCWFLPLILTLLFTFTVVSFSYSGKFVSTGVGVEERASKWVNNYPLKLVLTTKKGEYLAFVTISIFKGGKEVLKIPAPQVKGPWVFVSLPPGNYEIKAIRRNGQVVSAKVSIAKTGRKVVYLRF